jgi:hypothetical protein
MCPLGLVFAKQRKVETGELKYGDCTAYIDSVELIPFKQHIQIQMDKIGLTDLLPGRVTETGSSPEELDLSKKQCIFAADEHQFITEVEVRHSHLVMVLNYFSVYDRAVLYLLPFRSNAHPHSLILKGGARLQLRSNTNAHDSQLVEFSQPQGPLLLSKTYNIWKR